jgi:hypothetical protein
MRPFSNELFLEGSSLKQIDNLANTPTDALRVLSSHPKKAR